jgi:hypothetical protein
VGLGVGVNIKSKSDDLVDYKKVAIDSADVTVRWGDATQILDDDIEDEDIGEDIGIFRTSLIIGGGIEYNLSGDASIVAGLIFNNGFSNILNGSGVEDSNGEPVINSSDKTLKTFKLRGMSNVVSLQIGFLF